MASLSTCMILQSTHLIGSGLHGSPPVVRLHRVDWLAGFQLCCLPTSASRISRHCTNLIKKIPPKQNLDLQPKTSVLGWPAKEGVLDIRGMYGCASIVPWQGFLISWFFKALTGTMVWFKMYHQFPKVFLKSRRFCWVGWGLVFSLIFRRKSAHNGLHLGKDAAALINND